MSPTPSLVERGRQAEASGQLDVAYASYRRANLPAEAARVAARAGWFAEAAESYARAGMYYDSAVCFCRVERHEDALAMLVRVPRDHGTYRRAARLTIRLSESRGAIDLPRDHFLSRYFAAGVSEASDLDAFDRAARLYERQGDLETAHRLLSVVSDARPDFRDVSVRRQRIEHTLAKLSSLDVEHAREAVDFMKGGSGSKPASAAVAMPSLAELPDLPPVPRALRATVSSVAGVAAGGPRSTSARLPTHGEASPGPSNDAPCDALSLVQGCVLAGRYTIERKIGQGGMAAVYRARDGELDELVALKAFQSEDPQLVARFRQEVTLSRQIAHPNVVRLHDIGTHGALRFMTMELLEGRSLDALTGRPIAPQVVVELLLQAVTGLGAAHARGIVHRDIKPANFFLADDGTVKLMDFGIAKRQSPQAGLTAAGFLAGTPHYMAPEQIDNFSKATPLSDLYAIGVMAFELLTGRVPFEHEDLMALLMMHLRAPVPSVRALVSDVPPELDVLVGSLLAKDPAARPQSCDEVARRLRRVLG
jgi:serine/threonine-protein kinase